VPTDFSAELIFADGVSAGFYCSFINFRQQWVNVSGPQGYLQVPDFVNPIYGDATSFEVVQFGQDGHKVLPNTRQITVPDHACTHPTSPESNLFRNFANQIASGKLNSDWPEWSRKTQIVLDACLASARAAGKPITLKV